MCNMYGYEYGCGGASLMTWLVKKRDHPQCRRTRICSLGQEGTLEKEMATHPSILA